MPSLAVTGPSAENNLWGFFVENAWGFGFAAPWIVALVLAFVPRRHEDAAAKLAVAGSLLWAVAMSAISAAGPGTTHIAAFQGIGWLLDPVVFAADGLSTLFALVTAWVYFGVTLFALRYVPKERHGKDPSASIATFHALMAAFAGSMVGMVTATDFIFLYFFWELTGIFSFLLIGFLKADSAARQGARRSLILNVFGGLAMLLGFLSLASMTGSLRLDAPVPENLNNAALSLTVVLLLTGALAKSAQLPFSSWLPGAMAAPTPVSAFLHSATLVAAGVYLAARFWPILSPFDAWQWTLSIVGASTMGLAGIWALFQRSFKGLLAYSTIAQYGLILLCLSFPSPKAYGAALFAFLWHAVIKAGLFLVAGCVTYTAEASDFASLQKRPSWFFVGLPLLVLAASLSGIPFSPGFYYKEAVYLLALEGRMLILASAVQLSGALTIMYMLRFVVGILLTPKSTEPASAPPSSQWFPVVAAAALLIVVWWIPELTQTLLAIAAPPDVEPVFAPHIEWGQELFVTTLVLLVGAGLYVFVLRRRTAPPTWLARPLFSGAWLQRAYQRLALWVLALHSGSLRVYLLAHTVGMSLLVLACLPVMVVELPARSQPLNIPLLLSLLVSVMAAALISFTRRYIILLIALNTAGYALGVTFLLLHAPNVALAQVLVETLATLVFVMALREGHIVSPARATVVGGRGIDSLRWLLCLGFGAAVGFIAFIAATTAPERSVGMTYAHQAHRITGAPDLVAVILADFRSLDTIIEIFIFATSMLALYALTKRGGFGRAQ